MIWKDGVNYPSVEEAESVINGLAEWVEDLQGKLKTAQEDFAKIERLLRGSPSKAAHQIALAQVGTIPRPTVHRAPDGSSVTVTLPGKEPVLLNGPIFSKLVDAELIKFATQKGGK